MTEQSLIERQRQIVQDLARLAEERAAAERAMNEAFEGRTRGARQLFEETARTLRSEYSTEKDALEKEYAQVRRLAVARYHSDTIANEQELDEAVRRLWADFESARDKADSDYSENRWTMQTVYEANKAKIEGRHQETQRKIAAYLKKMDSLQGEAAELLGPWIAPHAETPTEAADKLTLSDEEVQQRLKDYLEQAEKHLAACKKLLLPKILRKNRFWYGAAVLAVLAAAPAALHLDIWPYWVGGALGGVAVAAVALFFWLRSVCRRQVQAKFHPLSQVVTDAGVVCDHYKGQVKAGFEAQILRNRERYENDVRQAEEKYRKLRSEIQHQRDTTWHEADDRYSAARAGNEELRDTTLSEANENYPRQMAERKARFEADSRDNQGRHDRETADAQAQRDRDYQALSENWLQGVARLQGEADSIRAESDRFFPPWDSPVWDDFKGTHEVPNVLRFGEFQIKLAQVPGGLPEVESLRSQSPEAIPTPAFAAFPQRSCLLYKASDEGRQEAENSLQTVMFRLLTALPPGKVRFTILDPVGLGQNYAAYMHLADFDELLVTSRIWTESQHIEQRLTDLTEHMEKVIQKFLRNQYETIEEYNKQAGEVAEPFRFLVVANFPSNFSPDAARRLVSIAASGPRCGVFTLVTVDTKQPLPQGFDLKDLEQHSVCLVWKEKEGRFAWREPEFGKFPFQLDPPADAEFINRLMPRVGQLAKDAKRVEVPFEFVAPADDRWWTWDSRAGVQVPLGRAGATKRQVMSLGKGTSQHVLIAGKTGSGKSTLLHAFITNIALMYSPQEVELYLVDFKEGVEFKAYATHELPHARLVAIESEREFGLSVLQRLDAELKRRGDLFRQAGVQDINNYRSSNGQASLPRIMLVVDEFQLFFVEDDKIAQESALLLDRLVRQGRAFGIHVLLGSQTLGGAYSLARSTIGQMAVRIALQCSESDAHLILSDDNPAARLLSRPGEAIYNDANGLVEGNDFFQVVWLSEEQREDYLARVHQLAVGRHMLPDTPQIVFEGKAPADIAKNYLLTQLLSAPAWPTGPPRGTFAWLGEALAIKDPTAAPFRPQTGSNLIVIGQYEEAALGVFTTIAVSLATQLPPANPPVQPRGARFVVLDSTPVDSPHAGFLNKLSEVLPHPVQVGGWRELPTLLGEVAAEVERRQQNPESDSSPTFLFIHGAQRFRDLRKGEDDYGFGKQDENKPQPPSKLFSAVLRDGPAVGVHTVVWFDTLNNVNRSLDRQGLREFEMRVLFQMSATDSSNLIDSPLASKLGVHRAMYYSEERGQPEKFRPYAVPPGEWLQAVKEKLARKLQPVAV